MYSIQGGNPFAFRSLSLARACASKYRHLRRPNNCLSVVTMWKRLRNALDIITLQVLMVVQHKSKNMHEDMQSQSRTQLRQNNFFPVNWVSLPNACNFNNLNTYLVWNLITSKNFYFSSMNFYLQNVRTKVSEQTLNEMREARNYSNVLRSRNRAFAPISIHWFCDIIACSDHYAINKNNELRASLLSAWMIACGTVSALGPPGQAHI